VIEDMKGKSVITIHVLLVLAVTAVFIWSIIKPASYLSWVLEVTPAIIILIVVLSTYKKFRLTTLSYVIIALMAILMFVGGHYTYSKVPLFNWIKDTFDFKRNHYDRFGHFIKGMFSIVIRELLLRKTALTKGNWLFWIVTSISLAISAIYEIIEWISFIIGKGGKTAENFLGNQGDIWDAQWDMALTLIGTIVALLFLSKLHNRLLQKELKKNSIPTSKQII
jgi:putative membrane protein